MKHQEKEHRVQLQDQKRTEAEQRRAERQAMKEQREEARRQRQEEKRALLEQRREEKRLEKERIEEERRMEPAPLSYEKEEKLERNLIMNSLSKKNRQSAVRQLHQSMAHKNVHQPSVAQSRARPGNLGAQVFI
jgi:hypothetical protein